MQYFCSIKTYFVQLIKYTPYGSDINDRPFGQSTKSNFRRAMCPIRHERQHGHQSIPFPIKAKEEDKVTTNARAAFKRMCDTASDNNIDMTLDEINAEIREVRRINKERNNDLCSN